MNDQFVFRSGFITIAIALMIIIALLPFSIADTGFVYDRVYYVIGRDFLNFWQQGQAFWQDVPQQFYDSRVYNQHLDQLLAHDYKDQRWSYMPHTMLLAAPFGLLNYNLALAIFTGLGLCVFYCTAISGLTSNIKKIALILSPAVIICLLAGQFSLFVAAIFVFVIRYGDERPIIAALCIAVLTIKPQLGLLLPVYLLATARYRLFLYAVIACAAFLALSLGIQGVDIWRAYFESSSGQVAMLDKSPDLTLGLMPTLTVQLGLAGLASDTAFKIHLVVSLCVLGLSFFLLRQVRSKRDQLAILIAGTFIITPYLMAYDIVIVCWLILFLLEARVQGWGLRGLYLAVMLLPFIGPLMVMTIGVGASFILWAFAIWVYYQAFLNARPKGVSQALMNN